MLKLKKKKRLVYKQNEITYEYGRQLSRNLNRDMEDHLFSSKSLYNVKYTVTDYLNPCLSCK